MIALENRVPILGHPEYLRFHGSQLVRFDGSLADPIRQGAADLGWAGDDRLCLYVDQARKRWLLLRLEWDGEYRLICESPRNGNVNPAVINQLILRLIAHDQQRGFDVRLHVVEHNDRLERANQSLIDDQSEEIAKKLTWAARRELL